MSGAEPATLGGPLSWPLEDYALRANAMGALVALGMAAMVLRSVRLAALGNARDRDGLSAELSRDQVALEFFCLSIAVWVPPWILAMLGGATADNPMPVVWDYLNSALVLAASVSLACREFRPQKGTGSKLLGKVRRRSAPVAAGATILAAIGFVDRGEAWLLPTLLSSVAGAALATAIVLRNFNREPGSNDWTIGAVAALAVYTLLQWPAALIQGGEGDGVGIVLVALAGSKPVLGLAVALGIAQGPKYTSRVRKFPRFTWGPIIGTREAAVISIAVEWLMLVYLWAPHPSLAELDTMERGTLSVAISVALLWLTASLGRSR